MILAMVAMSLAAVLVMNQAVVAAVDRDIIRRYRDHH
jgi:hypothetical protein